jgi:hypothetical protein
MDIWKTQENTDGRVVEWKENCEVKNPKHVHREVIFQPTHIVAQMDLNRNVK